MIVPFFHHTLQLLTLLIGFKIEILVLIDKAVGGKSQIALDAGFADGLSGGIGIIIQVRYGGNAKAQALGNGQLGSGQRTAGVHFVLLAQLFIQRLPTGQVIAVAAQCRGSQMGVAVNEAGDGHHAGAVDDGGRLLGRGGLTDVSDLTAIDTQKSTEQNLHFFVHGHNGDIGNQFIQDKTSFR